MENRNEFKIQETKNEKKLGCIIFLIIRKELMTEFMFFF